jgi:Na+(H+)/acetate symporter ActP
LTACCRNANNDPSGWNLNATGLLAAVLAYFAVLQLVAWRTSRRADEKSFFVGNRRSAWPLVAFGMVGTSLPGVTFVSVPGAVGANGFTNLQWVLGHVLGYAVVALVLLPLYHRLQVVSIYGLLRERLGTAAHRTGAGIFIAARTVGATARLYLVIQILQLTILDAMGLPFWLTCAVIVLMILAYTVQGGVRTIVWTDTLQTAAMLLGLVLCAGVLLQRLDLTAPQAPAQMQERGLPRLWGTDPQPARRAKEPLCLERGAVGRGELVCVSRRPAAFGRARAGRGRTRRPLVRGAGDAATARLGAADLHLGPDLGPAS